MKIGFTTDTNFFGIKNQHNYNGASFLNEMDFFINYTKDLKTTTSKKTLEYFVSDLVIEELYYQKLDTFKNSYDAFVKKYKLLQDALIGEVPTSNIETILNNEREFYKEKTNLLKIDYTEELFSEMIKDSLIKKPPFDKNKANTGFKDSLIWKTVIYSKDIDECNEFYFFSGDKIFRDSREDLTKEFIKMHPKVKLHIEFFEPNGNQRQAALKLLIDTYKLYETEVVKLYNSNIIVKYLDKLKYSYTDVSYYCGNGVQANLLNILFNKFDNNDFYVYNVDKKNDEYTISCEFRTMKYTTDIEIIDEDKKYLLGNVKIVLKEKESDYLYVNGEVTGIDFDLGVVDLLRGFAIKGTESIASGIVNIINENMKINFEAINPLKGIQEVIKNNYYPLTDIKVPNAFEVINKEKNNQRGEKPCKT